MKYCPKCNSEYEDNVNFCKKDGTPLETGEKNYDSPVYTCPKCGTTNPHKSRFCSNCGATRVASSLFTWGGETAARKCPKCKKVYIGTSKFCNDCGKDLKDIVTGISDDFAFIEGKKTDDFLMSKYEVTQELYEAVIGTNPSSFKGPKRPVENISWADAIEFCNTLSLKEGLEQCYSGSVSDKYGTKCNIKCNFKANGYRLPTCAEWSCATKNYGFIKSHSSDYAWVEEFEETHDVGLKLPSDLGLYDLLGNVGEWCWDYKKEDYHFVANYAIRGHGGIPYSFNIFSTIRLTFKSNDIGFRIVRNIYKN